MSFIITTKSVANSYFECKKKIYTNNMRPGQQLAEWRKEARLTQAQFAERVGISPNYVSALERDEPNALDGSPRRPRVNKVDKMARVLNVPIDKVRDNFGYAPSKAITKPQTIAELVAALESLGIEPPQLYGGYPQDADGDGYREVIERIWLDIELVINRLTKGRNRPRFMDVTISDADVPDESEHDLIIHKTG